MVKPVPIAKVIAEVETFVSKLPLPIVELIEAQTKDPFKVLVTTILSARTKDETTATVVKNLFKKIDKPADLRKYTTAQLEKLIYPIGFYKNKAKFLSKLPDAIDNEFNGVLPGDVNLLTKLPGVGRKTANLVVAVAFQKPAICVDIHVHRISNRLGYIKTETPFESEMELRRILPQKHWMTYNTIFVAFGQSHCRPISPRCSNCPIKKYCNQVGVMSSR